EMAGAMARGQVLADLLVKGEQTDGVALEVEEISQGRGESIGVLGFGVVERSVGHRPAVIDKQMAAQVGFVLKFLDEVPVAASVEAPVQVAGIVAGGILSVFCELDGETVIGTAVQPVPETLDDHPGAQFQV